MKKSTSNTVLTILAIFIFFFIVVMTITFWVKDSVPDTLIQYTLGAGGVEVLMLAGIKISKVFKGEPNSSNEDTEDDEDELE